MDGLELASKVSTKHPYELGDKNSKKRLAVIDLGIKKNILDNLSKMILSDEVDSKSELIIDYFGNELIIRN